MEIDAVQEASLVRLAINALQGMQSALLCIEKLSTLFCNQSADRTSYEVPELWDRFSSTLALSKILKSIMCTGSLVFVLQKFVEHFMVPNSHTLSLESDGSKEHPPYSLVNQAFAVAVAKVLEGYISALDTLYSSVSFRRASNILCVKDVTSREVTLLDVFLHTRGLSDRIESLGNICNLHDAAFCLSVCLSEEVHFQLYHEFHKFYKGGDLLSYLYRQVQVSDSGHYGLLKFLFLHSYEPYCQLLRSWIFEAEIVDPFEEFLIQDPYEGVSKVDCEAESSRKFTFAKIRETVSIPCFLSDLLVPIVRTGQQLQILKRFLPNSSGYIDESFLNEYRISFKRKDLDVMIVARNNLYGKMHERANSLWTNLAVMNEQALTRSVFPTENDLGCFFPTVVPSDRTSRSMNSVSNANDGSYFSDWSESLSWSDCDEQTDVEATCCIASSSREQNMLSCLTFVNKLYTEKVDSHCLTPVNIGKKDSTKAFVGKVQSRLSDLVCSENSALRSKPVTLDKPLLTDETKFLGLSTSTFFDGLLYKYYERLCQRRSNDAYIDTNVLCFDEGHCCESSLPIDQRIYLCENFSYREKLFKLQKTVTDYPGILLSLNPMLRSWTVHKEHDAKNVNSHYTNQLVPYMDFSMVKDPKISFQERKPISSVEVEKLPPPTYKDATTVCESRNDDKQGDTRDILKSSFCSVENQRDATTCTVGGSSWESLLCCLRKYKVDNDGDCMQNMSGVSEFPLDIVIKKCIFQEILLQYNYVSKLSIRLLEDGFELSSHFLALRRYYFMEVADWADLFVMSLWRHMWHNSDLEQIVTVLQGLLTRSIQRSSCERDPKKERLFIYIRSDNVPILSSPIGLSSFDFIGLGYRVNWPTSIVVTPCALEIYANIFSFLIKVRLSALSLTDAWKSLKHLRRLIVPPNALRGQGLDNFNLLMKTRHQLDHLLAALQQYLQSQLSQVSWCHFIDSLHKKVKDIMDLETVHLAYLTDSESKCFLSDAMLPVASIIEDILHCTIALQQFVSAKMQELALNQDVNATLSKLNMSQLHQLRQKFETNIKELHQLYTSSHKYGDSPLSRFWECLNGNEYYSDIFSGSGF